MTDIALIAKGLSKAQRAALAGAWQASWGEWFIPDGTRWDVRRRLVALELLSRKPAMPLRKKGLAVREYLERNPND